MLETGVGGAGVGVAGVDVHSLEEGERRVDSSSLPK